MIWIMTIIPFYIIYSHVYNHLYNPIFLYQCKLYGAPKMGPCWPWSGGLWKEAIRLFQHLEAGLYLDKSWIRVWNFQDLHLTLLQDDHVYIYIKQYIYIWWLCKNFSKLSRDPPWSPSSPQLFSFSRKGIAGLLSQNGLGQSAKSRVRGSGCNLQMERDHWDHCHVELLKGRRYAISYPPKGVTQTASKRGIVKKCCIH